MNPYTRIILNHLLKTQQELLSSMPNYHKRAQRDAQETLRIIEKILPLLKDPRKEITWQH